MVLIKVSILQIVLLAITCLLITFIFNPEASIVAGMVLIAACPAGALSNYYSYLAKGDVAFLVSLTALSTLLSFVTPPFFIEAGFYLLLDTASMIVVPATQLISQLFFILLIPICCGILLRYFFNSGYLRYHVVFQRITLIALLALIIFISWEQADYLWQQIYSIIFIAIAIAIAIAFNVILLLAGFWLSRFISVNKEQSIAILFELPVRNLGIAAITGATLLGYTEIVVFSAAFIVIQQPIMLLVVIGIGKFESHLWALRGT
ncbi:MAG: hypothetical protein GWO88_00630 [Planctomycetia bacterium]|nr:hypothetical protein [Planctomycetia bacterium]